MTEEERVPDGTQHDLAAHVRELMRRAGFHDPHDLALALREASGGRVKYTGREVRRWCDPDRGDHRACPPAVYAWLRERAARREGERGGGDVVVLDRDTYEALRASIDELHRTVERLHRRLTDAGTDRTP